MKSINYSPSVGVYTNPNDMYSSDRGLTKVEAIMSQGEAAVGRVIRIGRLRLKVVEAEKNGNCRGCYFFQGGICNKTTSHKCTAYSRYDKTWVIFKKVDKDGSFKQ